VGAFTDEYSGKVYNNTYRTYRVPELAAPVPNGSSWTNLDLCGGWGRTWVAGIRTVNNDEVILRRVLAGKKLCGSVMAYVAPESGYPLPVLDDVRRKVAKYPDLELVETPHFWGPNTVICWIAPRKSLGEAIDVNTLADWYDAIGLKYDAALLRDAYELWLPSLSGWTYDIECTGSCAITGAVLGYPPASTAGL
jgi:hypothetical protein